MIFFLPKMQFSVPWKWCRVMSMWTVGGEHSSLLEQPHWINIAVPNPAQCTAAQIFVLWDRNECAREPALLLLLALWCPGLVQAKSECDVPQLLGFSKNAARKGGVLLFYTYLRATKAWSRSFYSWKNNAPDAKIQLLRCASAQIRGQTRSYTEVHNTDFI